MSDQGRKAIRQRLTDLFTEANLNVGDADMDRMVSLVMENQAAGARVRKLFKRYDEPAFGLPSRRRP